TRRSSDLSRQPPPAPPAHPPGRSRIGPFARLAHDERLRLVQFVQAAATVLQVQGRQRRHVALTRRQREVQRARLRFLALGHRAPFAAVVPLHAGRGGVEDAERGALYGGQFTGGNGAHLETRGVGLAVHATSFARSRADLALFRVSESRVFPAAIRRSSLRTAPSFRLTQTTPRFSAWAASTLDCLDARRRLFLLKRSSAL